MQEYQIVQIDRDNFKMLIPLMENCFGMKVNLGYFRWKFINNPAGPVVGFVAVIPQGDFAAYYGAIPERYCIMGDEVCVYQSCDTMTHSNHRRKGLFKKLAIQCYDYLEKKGEFFITGFSGVESTPGFLKFGWRHVFNVYYYFKPRIFSKVMLLKWRRSHELMLKECDDVSVVKQLLLESNCSTTNYLIKDHKFVGWRLENPLKKYNIVAAFGSNDPLAYAIYYIEDNKLVIFDAYDATDTPAVKKVLGQYLDSIIVRLKLKGALTFAQENTRYTAFLKSIGFVRNKTPFGPLNKPTPFIIYSSKNEMSRNISQDLWNVNPFDHDAF